MRSRPREGWILAGTLDGAPARPALDDDVAGMPYVLRLACDLAHAGVQRIVVAWSGEAPPPPVDRFAADPRLRGATLEVIAAAALPAGAPDASADTLDDAIVLVRADRIYHRDVPKLVMAAWASTDAPIARLAGFEHDAVLVTARPRAVELARAAAAPGGIADTMSGCEVAHAEPPYLAFTSPAPDPRALRRAERQLVWSMRKRADGLASRWINRHLSLRFSHLVMRTPIHPNHITVFCFLLAVTGGIVIAQGGYLAGVVGMALVNLGSILDGSDGELARLKYQYSRAGQWMDTLADDFGNVAYVTGIALNLGAADVTWAPPLAAVALACFAATQITQYYLITRVYRSGDLAAIPWAFQSHDFLSAEPTGLVAWVKATVPKTLKRDFALTMFVGFAAIGRLDAILLVFAAGAVSFFVVFAIQLARNLGAVVEEARRPRG